MVDALLGRKVAFDLPHLDAKVVQPRRRIDATRALTELGWTAQTPFEDGLRETIAWYRANRAEAERPST